MLPEILLVEESPGDIRLTHEAFRNANSSVHLNVATDGVEAMAFLRHEGRCAGAPRPSPVLLDLNMLKMDGREVPALIQQDVTLRTIPTVILTTSDSEADILMSYQLQASCYLRKPVELDSFDQLVRSIDDFWLKKVQLPPESHAALKRLSGREFPSN